MLLQHGLQKHFGLLLPPDQTFTGAPGLFSAMWVAGTLEIIGGLLLAIGLFTRPVAFALSGLMASAYFIVHAPQGFWPILNQGELAALYCFVFLAFAAIGGGPYSVDGAIGAHRGGRVVGEPRPKFRTRSGRDRRSAHVAK
jgi:putative oxidoreductase